MSENYLDFDWLRESETAEFVSREEKSSLLTGKLVGVSAFLICNFTLLLL